MHWRRWVLGLLGAWLGTAAVFELGPPLPVPVDGVRPRQLRSTFGAPRAGGRRRHRGVDIFAARGTPVRAAGRGIVVRVGSDRLGGRVVWVLGVRGVLCYYAHLTRPAPDLHEGQMVGPDRVLGWVGNTGNARTTRPHLHFETRPLYLGLAAVDPVPVLGGWVHAAEGSPHVRPHTTRTSPAPSSSVRTSSK